MRFGGSMRSGAYHVLHLREVHRHSVMQQLVIMCMLCVIRGNRRSATGGRSLESFRPRVLGH